MTSWRKPTAEQVDAAVRRLMQAGQIRYFFDKLENPEWVEPLWNKGFFRKPPPPIPGSTENTIAFPIWPEARYLARMGKLVPELVLKIIEMLPTTENARVLEDLVDAALQMPPEISKRLLLRLIKWVENPYYLLIGEKFGALISHFAKAGDTQSAFQIAGALLAILRSPETMVRASDGSEYRRGGEPTARLNEWEYGEVLKNNFYDLLEVSGRDALKFLCSRLKDIVAIKSKGGTGDDHSFIWRPAIEEHEQNLGHTLEDALISATRDAALQLASKHSMELSHVVNALESQGFILFRRIALHVLAYSEIENVDLIAERLLQRRNFDDSRLRHEYVELLRRKFAVLSDTQQSEIVSWINNGPDVPEFKQSYERHEGKPPTPELVQRYVWGWQRDRIAWLGLSAPKSLSDLFTELVTKVGQPEHPDFSSFRTSWVGPTSPKTLDELQNMNLEALIDYLRTWEPEKNWRAPSREGLARILEGVITERAKAFSEQAAELCGLRAEYARAAMSAFAKAIASGTALKWEAIFEFCAWILKQKDAAKRADEDERDRNPWSWVRKSIADLLENGFRSNSIPLDLRQKAWEILEPLTIDSDPAPEDEDHFGGDNMAPWDIAINTVRGSAFHALFQYGLWCLRRGGDGETPNSSTFDTMPEIREVLEYHLNTANDPSFAVRSVYGQFFPWIALMDREWAREHVPDIFPVDEGAADYWDAAWLSYIFFTPPYDDALALLAGEYLLAAKRLMQTESDAKRDSYGEFLARHLMTFYWRGKLDEDSGRAILKEFWECAPQRDQVSAFRFIGLSLGKTTEEVPQKIVKRLQELWEVRLREIGENSNANRDAAVLREFGWWFTSDAFPDDWALDQLSKVLATTPAIEHEREVVAKLVGIFAKYPVTTAQAFKHLVEGAEKPWGFSIFREPAKELLRLMLAHADSNVVSIGRAILDSLGAQGHLELRALLGEQQSSVSK